MMEEVPKPIRTFHGGWRGKLKLCVLKYISELAYSVGLAMKRLPATHVDTKYEHKKVGTLLKSFTNINTFV